MLGRRRRRRCWSAVAAAAAALAVSTTSAAPNLYVADAAAGALSAERDSRRSDENGDRRKEGVGGERPQRSGLRKRRRRRAEQHLGGGGNEIGTAFGPHALRERSSPAIGGGGVGGVGSDGPGAEESLHRHEQRSRRRARHDEELSEEERERHRKHEKQPPSRRAGPGWGEEGYGAAAAASGSAAGPAGWRPLAVPFSFALSALPSSEPAASDGAGASGGGAALPAGDVADVEAALDALMSDLASELDVVVSARGDGDGGGGGGAPNRGRRLRWQQWPRRHAKDGAPRMADGSGDDLTRAAGRGGMGAAGFPAERRAASEEEEQNLVSTAPGVQYDGAGHPPAVEATSSTACPEPSNENLRCYLIDATVTVLTYPSDWVHLDGSLASNIFSGQSPQTLSAESDQERFLVQAEVVGALNGALEEGRLDEAIARVNPASPIRGARPLYGIGGGGGAAVPGREEAENRLTDIDVEDGAAAAAEENPRATGASNEAAVLPSSSKDAAARASPSSGAEEEGDEGGGEGGGPSDSASLAVNATDGNDGNATDGNSTGTGAKGATTPPAGRRFSDFAIVMIALGSAAGLATILDCHRLFLRCVGGYVHDEDEEQESKGDDGGEEDGRAAENGGGDAGADAGAVAERSLSESELDPEEKDDSSGHNITKKRAGSREEGEMDGSSSFSALANDGVCARHRDHRERGLGCPPGEESSTVCEMSMSQANWSGLSAITGVGGANGGGDGGTGTGAGALNEHGSYSGISVMMCIEEGCDQREDAGR